jgi:4-carboxymuconolactone decarboxylase
MSERLRRLRPSELSQEQSEILRRFSTGRRVAPGTAFTLVHPNGGLTGPADAWLRSPALGRALEQVGGVLRYELQLSDRSREIAILAVAYFRDSPFEIYAHLSAGRKAGLTDEEMAALRDGTDPGFPAEQERAVHRATAGLLAHGTLDDAEYAAAFAVLGERLLFELVVLVGYYQLLATQLSVFGVLPPDAETEKEDAR